MAVFANIISTFDPRGINNARKTFAGLASDSLSAGRKSQLAMKLVGGAAATAATAVGAFAVKLGVDGVRAAIEDEKSVRLLSQTLQNLGMGFKQTNIEEFVSSMQFATGVSDGALRPALQRLLMATNDVSQSQRMLQIALDISASTGKDLESVTLAMSKAALGNFTALTRLGVPLDKTIIKNQDLTSALNALENQFQGASAAAANTYAGKIAILTQKVDEAKEAIGYDLITAIELATGALDGTNSLGDAALSASDSIGDFVVGLGYYIGQIDVSVDETNRFTRALERTAKLAATFIFGPIGPALATLGQAFGFVADKGNDLKDTTAQNALTAQTAGDRYLAYAKSLGFVTEKSVDLTDKTEKQTKATKDAEKALKAANDAAIKTAEQGIDKLEESLRNAQRALDDVQGKFDDFKSTIVDGVTGIIDFNSAVEQGDFLGGLVQQANNAKSFAEKVKTLIQLGLSERSLREVIRAGYESGTIIADQIIAGGTTVVKQVNELVGAVDELANIVGQTGAETFYAAGIAQGQAMVKGIQDALDQAKLNLSALKGETAPGMTTANEIKYLQTLKPTPGSAASFRIAEELDKLVQRRATGGPVNAMQPYVVGENGPELFVPSMAGAIIPNGAMANSGSVSNFNITVNAGIGTDGAVVGRQIVDAIRKYERSSGQVFARV